MAATENATSSAAATLLILAADRALSRADDAERFDGGAIGNANGATLSRQHSSANAELRKANKPLMEKRRRARINKSLNELKSILMESMERNAPGHSKWEKADILEMTVQYLHCLRNQQKATRTDPLAVGQFIAGFSECIRQTQKFSTSAPMSQELHHKLVDHLLSYLKTFSDDATRALQTTASCPSPPMVTGCPSDTSGVDSANHSPPSGQSLSNYASSSPRSASRDSADSDGECRMTATDSPGVDTGHFAPFGPLGQHRSTRMANVHDRNNNATGLFMNGSILPFEKDSCSNVWRPW